jgi:hypothetical protein
LTFIADPLAAILSRAPANVDVALTKAASAFAIHDPRPVAGAVVVFREVFLRFFGRFARKSHIHPDQNHRITAIFLILHIGIPTSPTQEAPHGNAGSPTTFAQRHLAVVFVFFVR